MPSRTPIERLTDATQCTVPSASGPLARASAGRPVRVATARDALPLSQPRDHEL